AQLRAIVGIELQIERVEAKFKLSQNKSAADLAGIQSGLTGAAPSPSLADWMREAASGDG
ncbi:MAG: FMN-binding negative transcriptional regulator, partial [Xanthomonadales bacterium]|nr:FMN-binding negative transcriptional regulator [Xanthomonadales bacterium]